MQKFTIKVTRKNGSVRMVAVYLDDTTAELLKQAGDEKLLKSYLYEEYKASRKARQEAFWNKSLNEDLENGIDYEDKRGIGVYSFDNMDDERLQVAINKLMSRQKDILRFLYIEGRTQKEIAELFGIDKRSVSDAKAANADTGCNHAYEQTEVAATCTEQGYTLYTCSNCGDEKKDNYTEAKRHNYTETEVAATCTTAAYTLYSCADCGHTYTEQTTAANGHTFEVVVVPNTCTHKGS